MGHKSSCDKHREVLVRNEGKYTVRVYLIQMRSDKAPHTEMLARLEKILKANADSDNPIDSMCNQYDPNLYVEMTTLYPGMTRYMTLREGSMREYLIYKVRTNVWGHNRRHTCCMSNLIKRVKT